MKSILFLLLISFITLSSCSEETICPNTNPDIPDYTRSWIPLAVGNYWNYVGNVDYFQNSSRYFQNLLITKIEKLMLIDTYTPTFTPFNTYMGKLYWYFDDNGNVLRYDMTKKTLIINSYDSSKKRVDYQLISWEYTKLVSDFNKQILFGTDPILYIEDVDVTVDDIIWADCELYQYDNPPYPGDVAKIYWKRNIGIVKLYEKIFDKEYECSLSDYGV